MDLKALRGKLSDIDRKLVELIAARQEIVGEIGRNKQTSGTATRDYAREKEVIEKTEDLDNQERSKAEELVRNDERIQGIERQIERYAKAYPNTFIYVYHEERRKNE